MATDVSTLGDGKVEIETSRLLLRGAREDDVIPLHEAFSNIEVMRYWSTLPHEHVSQTDEWVRKMIQSPQNGLTDFIMCLKDPKSHKTTPIGKIGVWQDEEIGFMLAHRLWGQGLAQEALKAAIRYFFQDRGMKQITADTDPRNAASIGLLKKLGFVVFDTKERTFEIGGEWVDSVYLKLTREQWDDPNLEASQP